jgi:hypothetical protein
MIATSGIVVVAAIAARVTFSLPLITIAATRRRTRSAARSCTMS